MKNIIFPIIFLFIVAISIGQTAQMAKDAESIQRLLSDLSNAWKSGSRILDTAVSLLPNAILAIVIFVAFLFIASAAKSLVRRFSRQQQKRQSLGLLLGQLAQVTVVVLGFLISFSVIAPSFQAADLIKVLGIGSVAIGFAFQNICRIFWRES
jgi:small-conductance mechanosensitive channel